MYRYLYIYCCRAILRRSARPRGVRLSRFKSTIVVAVRLHTDDSGAGCLPSFPSTLLLRAHAHPRAYAFARTNDVATKLFSLAAAPLPDRVLLYYYCYCALVHNIYTGREGYYRACIYIITVIVSRHFPLQMTYSYSTHRPIRNHQVFSHCFVARKRRVFTIGMIPVQFCFYQFI